MKKRPMRMILLFLATTLLPVLAQASMFEAEFAVVDRSTAVREEVIRQGLAEVLVRVSGYGLVVSQPLIDRELKRAERYVQRYHYQPLEVEPARPLLPMTGEELAEQQAIPRYQLWVIFDESAVKGLLRDANLMVWREPRPKILVWLAIEDGGKRQLVGANDRGVAREVLVAESKRRGLPLEFPLLDLEDRQAVKVGDIWHGFSGAVIRGSQRYTPNALLMGRLSPLDTTVWQVHWTLHQGTEQFSWQGSGEDVALLLAGGVGGSADNLSLLYAERFESGAADRLLLIDGVASFGAMRKLLDYLEKLEGIRSLQLVEQSGDRLLVELHAEGGMEMILDSLDRGGVVIPVAEPLPTVLPPAIAAGESGRASDGAEGETQASSPQPAASERLAARHYHLLP